MELNGKNAIVTGVSKGIGYATVLALLGKGVTVAGWGRTAPTIDNPNLKFYRCDVSDRTSVDKAYDDTCSDLGDNLPILVNNAGLGYMGPIEEMEVEQWLEMFDTNVHGVYYCTRAVVPSMKKHQLGHIVNVASIAGTNGLEMLAGYCGTKHAVVGISHSLFKELRNDGIKVTCIMPGSVQTNFFDNIETVEANSNMMQPEDIAGSIIYVLETSSNYLPADLEVRPLQPKGKS